MILQIPLGQRLPPRQGGGHLESERRPRELRLLGFQRGPQASGHAEANGVLIWRLGRKAEDCFAGRMKLNGTVLDPLRPSQQAIQRGNFGGSREAITETGES